VDKLYRNKLVIIVLIAPGLLTFLFAILAPILVNIYFSVSDWSGIGDYTNIGLANYRELFNDSLFWLSLRNALLLAAGFIIIQHPLAILTAVILDRLQYKAEGIFKVIYFIPNVISVAVIAHLWRHIFNPNFGLLNNIIAFFGGQGDTNWLGAGTVLNSVLIVLIWHGFGWGMLIYYTGIKSIDPVLYEAAAIDGGNVWQIFFRITLPQMKPVIQVNVTLAIISALKQMETVFLLAPRGGPGNEAQFIANYLYEQAFLAFRFSYGTAISVVFIIICLIATVVLNKAFAERENIRKEVV
jgi:raffinose/stachyose/melibiose transport system permease protein